MPRFLIPLTFLALACEEPFKHSDTAPLLVDTDTEADTDSDTIIAEADTDLDSDSDSDTEEPRFCDASDQCESDELCFYGRCSEQYGHEFDVHIKRGDLWITGEHIDNPPSLYVVYGHRTVEGYADDACTTATLTNLIFRWDESCRFTFGEDETFVIDVWQDTGSDLELLAQWQWVGPEILDLAEATHVPLTFLESEDIDLTIYIDPVHP